MKTRYAHLFPILVLVFTLISCDNKNDNPNNERQVAKNSQFETENKINKKDTVCKVEDNESFLAHFPEIDSLFIEKNELPYVVDSEFFYDLLYSNQDYKELDAGLLRILYENVSHSDENSYKGVMRAIIEVDSLKKSNVEEEKIFELYWEFTEINLLALHKFPLNADIEIYTWYVSFSDGNHGPQIIFVTIFQNKVPYSCFQLAENDFHSDSPMWSESYSESKILENGKVLIHDFIKVGSYDEETDEEESVESWEIIKELFIWSGNIRILRNERLDKN